MVYFYRTQWKPNDIMQDKVIALLTAIHTSLLRRYRYLRPQNLIRLFNLSSSHLQALHLRPSGCAI